MNKTIASISTPLGKGAISIIRLSGFNSLKIAEKVFTSKNLSYDKIKPRYMYLGQFKLNEGLENCMMVYFKGPKSYTGEDMLEFQVHGGTILTQKVLEKILEAGAILAEPGEFTKRAFENGKVSLDEAEAIVEEINSESENELSASLLSASGALKTKTQQIQNILTELIAQIEATLDYPEEDFEEDTKNNIFEKIQNINREIENLLKTSQYSRYFKNGINISIVGSPNVGKSSLLNAILGTNRAIVADLPGTTRDIIKESINYKGIKFNFIDTAGIRESADIVEREGVEKSRKTIKESDIVVLVLDAGSELSEEEKSLLKTLKSQNSIIVVNKIDKKRKLQVIQDEICISALKKENIDALLDKIYKKVITEEINFNSIVITNERQISYLKQSKAIIDKILNNKTQSMDIIAMQIKQLWNELGKITGNTENESIIDLIFSKFCLGK